MTIPVRITFRDMPPSPGITEHAERRAQKLETLFDHVIDCHVVVEEPHRHSRHGQKFHARIDLRVPNKELVVSRNSSDRKEDLYATLEDAFDDAERLLEDYARLIRSPRAAVNLHPPHGRVARIFKDRGYGFIEAEDGHEVYFHHNSVLEGRFEQLGPGMKVRFAEEDGDKGPQASTVHVVG